MCLIHEVLCQFVKDIFNIKDAVSIFQKDPFYVGNLYKDSLLFCFIIDRSIISIASFCALEKIIFNQCKRYPENIRMIE